MMFKQQDFWVFAANVLPEIREFLQQYEGSGTPSDENDLAILNFLRILQGEDPVGTSSEKGDFLSEAASKIREEWESLCREDSELCRRASVLMEDGGKSNGEEGLLSLLFPEEEFAGGDPEQMETEIRRRRTVAVRQPNPEPIKDPSKEILFSSNVLLTLPPESYYEKLDPSMREKVKAVAGEKQEFWFDHPILMGVDTDANEMIYGLRGLENALRYEKEKGIVPSDAEMTVILSLSVTHRGLRDLAHEYLANELKKAGSPEGLKVYLFTEQDTCFLASRLSSLLDLPDASEAVAKVFGVDGRYGRHYSFLKAVAPLWSLCMDSGVKGTFKIDLDQVFPQKELQEQTGKTAFQHFQTPLWGAVGLDDRGREVSFGMIAGALVNERDIAKGIYTPDVPLPDPHAPKEGEVRIFNKQKPMAVSTKGEMMTRYNPEEFPDHPDGVNRCISRVHVTGGTNGILCGALRDFRPFTPSFIGRAEDQAYLLSVLLGNPAGGQDGPFMRYVHEPGLIMRHDKEAFAGEAIAAAKLGTWIGDLLRQLYFSMYAGFLPGGVSAVKEETDPFTGCFITSYPFTMVIFRLILKALSEPQYKAVLLDLASQRLGDFVKNRENPDTIKAKWMAEREGWDLYYDALDLLESGMKVSSEEAGGVFNAIGERIQRCRIC